MFTTLDGKTVAEALYQKLLLEVSLLAAVPKLVVVMVGEDAASQTYVRSKTKRSQDLGFLSDTVHLPPTTSEEDVVGVIRRLNTDPKVHGILVQLPLPAGMSKHRVLGEIHPWKDVDGLHPENAGLLFQGHPRFSPCTPAGILEMLRFYSVPIAGRRVVVMGRSDIVGKPVAQLFLMNDATVEIVHSKTADLAAETSRADILIAAVGKPRFVKPEMVAQGAVVVDVGIHRGQDGKLVGDVDFESVLPKVGAISPVPGGVGPMTIAMLMKNLVAAARLQAGSRRLG